MKDFEKKNVYEVNLCVDHVEKGGGGYFLSMFWVWFTFWIYIKNPRWLSVAITVDMKSDPDKRGGLW